jgi:hypothetical protein
MFKWMLHVTNKKNKCKHMNIHKKAINLRACLQAGYPEGVGLSALSFGFLIKPVLSEVERLQSLTQ